MPVPVPVEGAHSGLAGHQVLGPGTWCATSTCACRQPGRAGDPQLSSTTQDKIRERTAVMQSSGLGVCWVTDLTPWVGAEPSVR